MKFTLSWLHEHLDTKEDIKNIESTLTKIGLEVEILIPTAPLPLVFHGMLGLNLTKFGKSRKSTFSFFNLLIIL